MVDDVVSRGTAALEARVAEVLEGCAVGAVSWESDAGVARWVGFANKDVGNAFHGIVARNAEVENGINAIFFLVSVVKRHWEWGVDHDDGLLELTGVFDHLKQGSLVWFEVEGAFGWVAILGTAAAEDDDGCAIVIFEGVLDSVGVDADWLLWIAVARSGDSLSGEFGAWAVKIPDGWVPLNLSFLESFAETDDIGIVRGSTTRTGTME